MRVLIGKLGEDILIGPNVTVSLLKVKGDDIHLGIEAPDDWNVAKAAPELVAASTVAEDRAETKLSDESRYFPEFA